MKRVVALLAATLVLGSATFLAACGGDGAEPGVPDGATLMLDFTPNAAHSGIYAARARGIYEDAGIDLDIQIPGASTDAPKLLEAGRIDFAVMDIHDLGIAREAGFDLVGVQPLVQRPLGAVIARDDRGIEGPSDLAGKTVGVTGLPSDDAVVESEIAADGGDPEAVEKVTIGFNAVADLAAGKVDAATAFWNVEGVTLKRRGVPVTIFRVDRLGAPRYPELVLATSQRETRQKPDLVSSMQQATADGYDFAVADPDEALLALKDAVPELDAGDLAAQMAVLRPALRADGLGFDPGLMREWADWDVEHGILETRPDLAALFSR